MSNHLTVLSQLERLGFPDLLLWLLTFAVVYGVLSQAKIPKSAASRAIISIVSGMLVLMAAPASLISVISMMSTNLILIVLGLLVLIVFTEASGVRLGKYEGVHGKKGQEPTRIPKRFYEEHPLEVGLVLIVLAALVFIGSGGLSLLGFQNINLGQSSLISIGFLVAVILAVLFLYFEKGEKEE
ncbi:TPA: hypothetical protein H1009_04090 [archaeon]|nr:hypothetical protein [Candidatus Naiadarchaeales archaeon SRR2090153.bin461]